MKLHSLLSIGLLVASVPFWMISGFVLKSMTGIKSSTSHSPMILQMLEEEIRSNKNVFAKSDGLTTISLQAHSQSSSPIPSPVEELKVVNLDSLASNPNQTGGDFTSFQPSVDLSSLYVKEEVRKAIVRQAGWFPMLLSPPLLDGSLAGDVGFDPFGFAGQTKDSLYYMREAEIKHARLAMLAAIGWPSSELWHKEIAGILGLPSILAVQDRAPSVLNGGLMNQWILGAGVVSLLIGAVLEFQTFQRRKDPKYTPGLLGFDPLGLYAVRSKFGLDVITEKLTVEEKEAKARFEMDLAEIKHGRLAMLAITAYALQEFISGIPVVEQTPFFFGDPIV